MATNAKCLFLILIVLTSTISCTHIQDEPLCTSRFDFESKLLREMMKLEFEMSQLKDKTNIALSKLDVLSNTLNDEHTSKLKEMTAFSSDIRNEVEEKTKLLEETKDNIVKNFTKLSTDLETKVDSKWLTIEAQAVKPSVAFLAHTVSDKSPGSNTKLTFTVAVTNTGDAYDTSTGYFTAPVNGTYWFSVQICMNKNIQVKIYAENKVIGNSYMADFSGQVGCSTTSAVSVLAAGNKVHVKSGGSVASGQVIYQDSYRWSFSSGALV